MHLFQQLPPPIPLDITDISPRAKGTFQNEPQLGLLSPSKQIVMKRLEIQEFREELTNKRRQEIKEYLWHRKRMENKLKGQEVQLELRQEIARNQILQDQVIDLGSRLKYWQETNFVYKVRDNERPKRFKMDNGAFVTTSPIQHQYQVRVDRIKDRFKHAFIDRDVEELQGLLHLADEQRLVKDVLPEIAITEEIFRRHHRLTGQKIQVKLEGENRMDVTPKQSQNLIDMSIKTKEIVAAEPQSPIKSLEQKAEKFNYKRLNNLLKMNQNEAALIQETSEKASRFFTSVPPKRKEKKDKKAKERPRRLTVRLPPPKLQNIIYKKKVERLGHVHDEDDEVEEIKESFQDLTLGRVGMTGTRGVSLDKRESIDQNYNRKSLFRKLKQ